MWKGLANTIESKRLKIRPFLFNDIGQKFDWFFDSDVMKWIPGGPDLSMSEHRKRIKNYVTHFEEFGFSKYLLTDKLSGEKIGDAGILHLYQTNMVELGYRIRKDRWQQGFATEACKAIIEHTFSETKIKEINAIVEKENIVSVAILEKKLNFQFYENGIFFGVPMCLYGMNIERYVKNKHLT